MTFSFFPALFQLKVVLRLFLRGEALKKKARRGGRSLQETEKHKRKWQLRRTVKSPPLSGAVDQSESCTLLLLFFFLHLSIHIHQAERDKYRQRNSTRPAMVARAQPDRKQLPLVLLRLLCLLPTGLPVRSVDFTRGTDNITVRQGDTAILR